MLIESGYRALMGRLLANSSHDFPHVQSFPWTRLIQTAISVFLLTGEQPQLGFTGEAATIYTRGAFAAELRFSY